MSQQPETTPFGTRPTQGIVHRRSPFSVADTESRATQAIQTAGAKLFAVIDHSGEAEQVGLSLRDTKLLIFGNPIAGTAAMEAAPLVALDLPLKLLIWVDDAGGVWMTYLSAPWLAGRHGLAEELAGPLSAVDALASRITAQ